VPAIDRTFGRAVLGIGGSPGQAILEGVAAGMIVFAGLVVSVAVLVAQFGAGQYSPPGASVPPRAGDQETIGQFVGPGVCSLAAAANVRGTRNAALWHHGSRTPTGAGPLAQRARVFDLPHSASWP
jgi:uncharacterized membrane protein